MAKTKFRSVDIPGLVRKKASEMKVSDKELFGSDAFQEYLQGLVTAQTKQWVRPPVVQVVASDPGMTAATNGTKMILNRECGLATKFSTRNARFKALTGMALHETAHCVYSNFSMLESHARSYERGVMPARVPDLPDAAEVLKAMDGKYRPLFYKLFTNLQNIIMDAHDENCIMRDNGKFVSECIMQIRYGLQMDGRPIEEAMAANNGRELDILLNCVFQLVRFGEILALSKQGLAPVMPAVKKFNPVIRRAVETDDTYEQTSAINEMVVLFWPYIKEQIQKAQRQKQQQQSGGSQQQQQGGSGQQQGNDAKQGGSGQPSGDGQSGSQSGGQSSNSSQSSGQSSETQSIPFDQASLDDVMNAIENSAAEVGSSSKSRPANRNNSSAVRKNTPSQTSQQPAGHQSSQGGSCGSQSGSPGNQQSIGAQNGQKSGSDEGEGSDGESGAQNGQKSGSDEGEGSDGESGAQNGQKSGSDEGEGSDGESGAQNGQKSGSDEGEGPDGESGTQNGQKSGSDEGESSDGENGAQNGQESRFDEGEGSDSEGGTPNGPKSSSDEGEGPNSASGTQNGQESGPDEGEGSDGEGGTPNGPKSSSDEGEGPNSASGTQNGQESGSDEGEGSDGEGGTPNGPKSSSDEGEGPNSASGTQNGQKSGSDEGESSDGENGAQNGQESRFDEGEGSDSEGGTPNGPKSSSDEGEGPNSASGTQNGQESGSDEGEGSDGEGGTPNGPKSSSDEGEGPNSASGTQNGQESGSDEGEGSDGEGGTPNGPKSSSDEGEGPNSASGTQNGQESGSDEGEGSDGESGTQNGQESGEGKDDFPINTRNPSNMDAKGLPGDLQDLLNGIMQRIKQAKAEDQVSKDMDKDTCMVIHATDMNSTHKGRQTYVKRPTGTAPDLQNQYNAIFHGIANYSKLLQRNILNALRDLMEGGVTHHLQFGRILEVGSTYRPDQKFYAKKHQPEDLPDMAVSVLVDLSASMHGPRIEAARKATILLYDFCNGLGIPCMVAGHNNAVNGIEYTVYTDFNQVGNKDRLRLAQMAPHPYAANRDGMAIEVSSNLLSKRPERIKMLIIISDGQPYDQNYGGEGAAQDIRSIIGRYRRKGIETFAAAIGTDKDRIRSIYGEGYIDITDLQKLPKMMTNIVKKRLLRNVS